MEPSCGSWPASIAAALLAAVVIVRLLFPRAWSLLGTRSGTGREARLPAGSLGLPLLGETPAFIFAAYSPAARVLRREAQRPNPPSWCSGGGLQRRVHGLAGAFFKSPQLKAKVTADMQRRVVGRAMDAWWKSGGGAPTVRVQDEAKSIVFEILVRALIGLDAGHKMQYLKQQFQEFMAGLISLPIKLPGTQLYRSLQAKKRMSRLIQKIIQEKRTKMILEEEGKHERGTPSDLIDVLLNNGSDELTDQLISDNMTDFMIPAEDSVPVLITLAVKYLSDCPQALQQLEEENMELKRRKLDKGETPEWTDYMSLTFTQHVITETLRLGNIINGIMRKAVRDVEVRGHLIPKGWRVLVYFRGVHLDAGVHEDPHAFNPWRWKDRADMGRKQQQRIHPFRRRAEAVPGGGPGQARGVHLSTPSGHQLQMGGRGGYHRQLPHGAAQTRDANCSDAQNYLIQLPH
ncbi:hypothetical protein PR202_ga11531 [Eleusine coracana subsp. coracana]|uniref:Uncharacterized protein n=1 Tax=Eleusine coracana subsp. coracana TaxID=191504 RepID=A0AAV5C9Q8_ELECO|nr:hypothetical protein PR202_ga11531 [Eleusine coracana subsp. coracana]